MFHLEVGNICSLLLASESANRVLVDIVGPHWLKACERQVGSPIIRSAYLAGQLFAIRKRLATDGSIPKERLSPSNMIHWNKFDLDPDALRSIPGGNGIIAEAEAKENKQPIASALKDLLKSCYGGEVIEILSDATRFFAPQGIKARSQVNRSGLIRMLRMAFDLAEFRKMRCTGS